MTALALHRLFSASALLLLAAVTAAADAERPAVTIDPPRPRAGDVAWLLVRRIPEAAVIEGAAVDRPLRFFPYAGGQAAIVGIDVDTRPGPHPWRLAILSPGRGPLTLEGRLQIGRREFRVQHLTVPPAMVDLDPETERRALEEGDRLRSLYQTVSPERLWRGPFTRPIAGTEPGTGFGARRVINGQPRSPHTGIDFAVALGTPVVAANAGRVALVADFFFPGRLVAIDHGLGLYTLYFHLDAVTVVEGDRVDRGQPIGTVGATGRATGPHLHFGAQVGPARVDPAALLGLRALD